MAVFTSLDQLPQFHNTVVTIGTFDGVHNGHLAILKQLNNLAVEKKLPSVVITFDPHPRQILNPNAAIQLLTSTDQKIKLLSEAGIQNIVVVPFNQLFAKLTAQEYIQEFLVKYFNPNQLVIGYDHHFGADRLGDFKLLNQLAEKYNYKVVEIPEQLIAQTTISSTKIRDALKEGAIQKANEMLGRDYSLKANVIKGAQLGRTIGFPTANLELIEPNQLLPEKGVYAVQIIIDEAKYNGMLNIGLNPTVSATNTIKLEVHIFDFNQNIYGLTVEICFLKKIRPEQKFDSIELLKAQLKQDEAVIRNFI